MKVFKDGGGRPQKAYKQVDWVLHSLKSRYIFRNSIFHDNLTNNTLRFMVEKVCSKLCSWDAKQLSLAGKINLAQLGSSNGFKKITLVGWDSVCQPKAHDRPGIRSLQDQNTSLMIKLGFSIMSNASALWVQNMGFKMAYKKPYQGVEVPFYGDHFQRDPWVPNIEPLCRKITLNSNLDIECTLYEMITENKDWNLEFLQLWVSEKVIQQIVGVLPPQPNLGSDSHLGGGPQRVRVFIWLVLKHQLLTNGERTRRGIGVNSAYGICAHEYETVLTSFVIVLQLETFEIIPTDGLVRAEDAFVAAGGILRDHNGRWIIGFTKYLGNCVVLDSELWGIKDRVETHT
ncbi:hypothetical protein Gorai_024666 [Gossypium raimondii]|uniref:Reverse transcriptase zinc-binding domain-containing protein n=1 Tax=Gossypium raimondii TaxID=29730 RepID=A0A7J8P069_GOSRA|nr:hypothetical protein [Gossypium raimondii]